MIIDFRKCKSTISAVCIDNNEIERVSEYKYLGTILDSKLSWNENTDKVFKKGQQRLHCLWKLKYFKIDQNIMMSFYRTFVQSVITYNFLSWFGNLSVQNKNKLSKILNTASKIIGLPIETIGSYYEHQISKKANKILSDSTHILFSEYSQLPSGRRLRMPNFRTNRYRHSFVPASIRSLNTPKPF